MLVIIRNGEKVKLYPHHEITVAAVVQKVTSTDFSTVFIGQGQFQIPNKTIVSVKPATVEIGDTISCSDYPPNWRAIVLAIGTDTYYIREIGGIERILSKALNVLIEDKCGIKWNDCIPPTDIPPIEEAFPPAAPKGRWPNPSY